MRRTLRLGLLLLGLGVLPSCLLEYTNDGVFCSEDATCPPELECSADGYCLFPCPEPDCLGDGCGCEPRFDDSAGRVQRVCGADGLCHLTCVSSPTPCIAGLVCDARVDECVRPCDTGADCRNGATCQATEGPTGGPLQVCRAP